MRGEKSDQPAEPDVLCSSTVAFGYGFGIEAEVGTAFSPPPPKVVIAEPGNQVVAGANRIVATWSYK